MAKFVISTGSILLNQLLDGGFKSRESYLVYGECGSGKSFLAHTIAVSAQLPSYFGGVNGQVIYVDTEGMFRPEIIKSVGTRWCLTSPNVTDNIILVRARNITHLSNIIYNDVPRILEERRICLIIIDSLLTLLHSEYPEREHLEERQRLLKGFVSTLRGYAESKNTVLYCTTPSVNGNMGGGYAMFNAFQNIIALEKTRPGMRSAKITKSAYLPLHETSFEIKNSGVHDI